MQLAIYSPGVEFAGEYYCNNWISWCLHRAILVLLEDTGNGVVKVRSCEPGYLLKYPGTTYPAVWVQTPPLDEFTGELLQVFDGTTVDAAVCVNW